MKSTAPFTLWYFRHHVLRRSSVLEALLARSHDNASGTLVLLCQLWSRMTVNTWTATSSYYPQTCCEFRLWPPTIIFTQCQQSHHLDGIVFSSLKARLQGQSPRLCIFCILQARELARPLWTSTHSHITRRSRTRPNLGEGHVVNSPNASSLCTEH